MASNERRFDRKGRHKMQTNMRNRIIAILAIVVGFGHATARATILTGPIVNPDNGHSYFLLDQNSWTGSEAEAVTLGGHLATINDATENHFVFTTFAAFGSVNRPLWIGFTDQEVEGTYQWISGEPVTYVNWQANEPNNFMNEDYAYIVQDQSGIAVFVPELWND